MALKETILNNILHDLTTCQHLATKIDPKNANWRPAENMRSTEELMQYISHICGSTAKHFLNPPVDRAGAMATYGHAAEWAAKNTNIHNFSQVVENQKGFIQDLFENVTDDQIMSQSTYAPWNPVDTPLRDALIGTTLKIAAAYRHQLFMYAKMQGANINTMNNWAGMDSPAQVRQEAAEEAMA